MSILRPTNTSEEGVLIYLHAGCRAVIEFPVGQGPYAAQHPGLAALRTQAAVHAGTNIQETKVQDFNWDDLHKGFGNLLEKSELRGPGTAPWVIAACCGGELATIIGSSLEGGGRLESIWVESKEREARKCWGDWLSYVLLSNHVARMPVTFLALFSLG